MRALESRRARDRGYLAADFNRQGGNGAETALPARPIARMRRRGELYELRWGDIDLKAGRLRVTRSISWGHIG
ncbi:MAG: hypothetical protein ABFS30_17575, partial [Pseudomonadota bacterium]